MEAVSDKEDSKNAKEDDSKEKQFSVTKAPHELKSKKFAIKKNDSGISIENPTTDSSMDPSTSEDGVSFAETIGQSSTPKPTSELSSPDSGLHGELSEGVGHYSSESEEVPPTETLNVSSTSDSNKLNTNDLQEQANYRTLFEKVELDDVTMSDSKDDDISEKYSDDKSVNNNSDSEPNPTSDTNDSFLECTPKTQRPSHKWFICKEILARQYGTFGNKSNDLFRLRCCSSLHMVERLELMYKMEKHKGCVNALHFNETGTRLVSSSDDLKVIIWDWTISESVLMFDSGHRTNVFQAKFLPLSGDCHIVSCARDGQVRLAELSSTGVCKRTRRLAQHAEPAHKLTIEPDTPHTFLSCGEDGIVFEIDLRCDKPEKLLTCKEDRKRIPFYTIHNNPVKTYDFAVAGKDKYIRIYDKRFIRDNANCRKFCPQQLVNDDKGTNVTCLVYNHNGKEILASYNDDDIYTFDESHSDGADYTHRYYGHRNMQTVKGVNYYGPNSEFIVSGSDCGNIFFWDHDSEHVVQYMHGDEGGVVNCLEPHPNCPILATSGLDDDVKIWVPSCEQPPKLEDLKKVIGTNLKIREEERSNESQDDIGEQVLMFLMRQGSLSGRRRMRHLLDDESSTSSESDDSSNDEQGDRPRNLQCQQS